jgi:hypothetical protein
VQTPAVADLDPAAERDRVAVDAAGLGDDDVAAERHGVAEDVPRDVHVVAERGDLVDLLADGGGAGFDLGVGGNGWALLVELGVVVLLAGQGGLGVDRGGATAAECGAALGAVGALGGLGPGAAAEPAAAAVADLPLARPARSSSPWPSRFRLASPIRRTPSAEAGGPRTE